MSSSHFDIAGGESDYEAWLPDNGDNNNKICFLGSVKVYNR